MSLKIGIVAALPMEARMLTTQNLRLRNTTVITDNILLRIGGVGRAGAQAAAEDLIAQGANLLISWGTAGGLSPGMAAGTLILGDRIISREEVFETDRIWREHFYSHLANITVHCGAVVEAEHIIASTSAKAQLFSLHQAVAVDMESAAIARVAKQAGAPFLAIRSIVDAADFALPEWLTDCLDPTGKIKVAPLIKYLCHQPRRLFTVLHLAQSFARAEVCLRNVAQFLYLAAETGLVVQPVGEG